MDTEKKKIKKHNNCTNLRFPGNTRLILEGAHNAGVAQASISARSPSMEPRRVIKFPRANENL